MSVTVSVVYHSGYGHTAAQAEAVIRGIKKVSGANAHLIKADDAAENWEKLENSAAIIFGSPTYMGTVSAPFKAFMDATSKLWLTQNWKDKLAAGFTNSSSHSGDKLSTLQQLAIFAAQHGMIWVSLGLMPGNNNSNGTPDDLNRLGSWLGAMAQSNADQTPDIAPTKGDLLTAEFLGQRVTEAALRWNKAT